MTHDEQIDYNGWAIKSLREMSKEQVLAHIRGILTTNGVRARFDMSGYDGRVSKGACTLGNQAILNRFAHLGLYDYTKFLFLDFYKGGGTVYYKDWGARGLEYQELSDLGGETTTEIIYKILEITVLSDKSTRRRD